jgi:hypothetical protein
LNSIINIEGGSLNKLIGLPYLPKMELGKTMPRKGRLYAMGNNEEGNGKTYGRLVVMAGHVTKQRKSEAQGRPKRKYVRREVVDTPVTQANVMMTQSNINLLARLLEGKNAPLIVVLVLVLSILYGVFVLAQDIRKDVREDMGRLSNNVAELTQAVKELKLPRERQQASN